MVLFNFSRAFLPYLQTDRQTDRHRERETESSDRQTERERETERDRELSKWMLLEDKEENKCFK